MGSNFPARCTPLPRAVQDGALALAIGLLLALAASPVAAQSVGSVRGLVVDSDTQQPIGGVQVVVISLDRTGLTNPDGNYTVRNLPVGTYVLRATSLGFSQQTRTITVGAGQVVVVNFELKVSALQIDGITVNVITGAAHRAREVGTNNGQISIENVPIASITSVEDMLAGRTEGVVLNSLGGTIGTGQRIRIRGSNSLGLSNEPLVFVDGILYSSTLGGGVSSALGGQDTSRLDDLNPNDIESIEILKGPTATGLYGTQAANGVLLITTKKGFSGKPRWNFYAEGGISQVRTDFEPNFRQVALRPGSDPSADPVNGDGSLNNTDFATCRNWALASGDCVSSDVRTISFSPLTDPRTTQFADGGRQRYGLNVAGGSAQVTYFFSGEYLDQVGVERRFAEVNTQTRTNFRGSIRAAVSDRLDLSVNTSYAKNRLRLPRNDNNIFGAMAGLIASDRFFPADPDDPFDPVTNRQNFFFGLSPAITANMIALQNVDRMTFSSAANYRGTRWLSFKASGGLDFTANHETDTAQPNKIPRPTSFLDGWRTSARSNNYAWTLNASAIATRDINDRVVSRTTAGISYFNQKNLVTFCTGTGLIAGTSSCGTTSSNFRVDEDFFQTKQVGFFGSQEVQVNDRLFIIGSVRGEETSASGVNAELAFYPNASVSWVLSEEEFFDISWIPELRLRGAFGTSGLQPSFRQARTLFAGNTVSVGGVDEPAVSIDVTGNPDLKPERTREFEFGFDVGLFDSKVGLEFTYFTKTSKDVLVREPVPPSFGLNDERWANLGEVKNSGTETSVSLEALNTSDFGVDLSATWTTFRSKIVRLNSLTSGLPFNRGNQRHKEGASPGDFFQRDFTFSDANGDGLIDAGEITVGDTAVFLGHAAPQWQGSFNVSIHAWDWLVLATMFEARGGNKQFNNTESFRCGSTRNCRASNTPDASLDQQARAVARRFAFADAGYIESADFLKWRELSLIFNVPDHWLSEIQGLSVTVAGRNLATWTDYSGIDPEIIESGASSNFAQNEFLTVPPVRSFSVRLNWAF